MTTEWNFGGSDVAPSQQPASSAPPTNSSYAYGQVQQELHYQPTVRGTDIRLAPWGLWASALAMAGAAGVIVFHMVQAIQGKSNDAAAWLLAQAVIVLAVMAMCVFMLKAQRWARYSITALAAVLMFFIVIDGYWPATLLGVLGAGLSWLPANNPWFGGSLKR